MAEWLTEEQRQICVGYNDGMFDRDRRKTSSDLYKKGYHFAMKDKASGRFDRTGREAALSLEVYLSKI